jgi:hypothetical protein
VCWIADCEICDVPMVVWRWHGTVPPADALSHMHEHLARVAGEQLTVEHYIDTTCAIFPITIMPTPDPGAGFSGGGFAGETPEVRPPVRRGSTDR